ncbi:hypothetical protein GE21DRAFT_1325329 [Neurospora crassa]|nr:hypothetical protein GE21DRAFT_1325329 [Neurospora crassa]
MSCSNTNISLGGSYCSITRGSGSSTNSGNNSSSQGFATVSPGIGSGGNTTCERELFIELFVVEAVETRVISAGKSSTSRDNKGSLFRASHNSTVIHPEPQLIRKQLNTCRAYFSCCGARSSSSGSGSGSGTGSTTNTGSGSASGGNTGGTTGTTGGGYGSGSSTTTVQNPSPSTTAVSSGTDRS